MMKTYLSEETKVDRGSTPLHFAQHYITPLHFPMTSPRQNSLLFSDWLPSKNRKPCLPEYLNIAREKSSSYILRSNREKWMPQNLLILLSAPIALTLPTHPYYKFNYKPYQYLPIDSIIILFDSLKYKHRYALPIVSSLSTADSHFTCWPKYKLHI